MQPGCIPLEAFASNNSNLQRRPSIKFTVDDGIHLLRKLILHIYLNRGYQMSVGFILNLFKEFDKLREFNILFYHIPPIKNLNCKTWSFLPTLL